MFHLTIISTSKIKTQVLIANVVRTRTDWINKSDRMGTYPQTPRAVKTIVQTPVFAPICSKKLTHARKFQWHHVYHILGRLHLLQVATPSVSYCLTFSISCGSKWDNQLWTHQTDNTSERLTTPRWKRHWGSLWANKAPLLDGAPSSMIYNTLWSICPVPTDTFDNRINTPNLLPYHVINVYHSNYRIAIWKHITFFHSIILLQFASVQR